MYLGTREEYSSVSTQPTDFLTSISSFCNASLPCKYSTGSTSTGRASKLQASGPRMPPPLLTVLSTAVVVTGDRYLAPRRVAIDILGSIALIESTYAACCCFMNELVLVCSLSLITAGPASSSIPTYLVSNAQQHATG